MKYIYMTEDKARYIAIGNPMAIFKVGYSNDPIRRGGQMHQAAKRAGITEEVQMRVKNHYISIPELMEYAVHHIEKYVILQVLQRPSATLISREFISISAQDRQYCYDHLQQWIYEAVNNIGDSI